jgi:hypothetical protein
VKKLHAFVATLFGKKAGTNGAVIGLNSVNKNKLLKPFDEPAFIQKSGLSDPGDKSRRESCFKIKPQTQINAAPIESGEPLKNVNSYKYCNSWLLYSAFAYGIEKDQFVYLWNGEGCEVPGGTAYMYHEVNDKTGQVAWLYTLKIW